MRKYRLVHLNVGAAGVLVALCTLLIVRSCRSAAEEDEVLEKKQLSELYSRGSFILESVQLRRCVSSDRSNLVLASCEKPTRRMLWKWVSRHRLFNLGSSLCLGLNTSDPLQPLGSFECDSPLHTLWWRCSGNSLFGAFQFKLAVTGRLLVVKKTAYHQWRRYSTTGEGPCAYPYEEIHTLLGNANGMPCALPFKYNNKWYPECTAEGREDHHLWCATTSRYDLDEKWGFCPSPELGCNTFWDMNQETKACYQFNLYTIMTWSQAHSSCQAQGGDLLSITDRTEQMYIRDRLADVGVMVWIGLNHLEERAGWHWSDGAPLALVNFTTGISAMPHLDNRQCGVYNSATPGHPWQSLSCESALPYICKKSPNGSRKAEPFDNWQYYPTTCAAGWLPHNRFCYRVQAEEQSWEEASASCRAVGANLTSTHSLADVELLLGLLANFSGPKPEVWIGLSNETSSAFTWSDGSMVTLTLWHKQEPDLRHGHTQLCVKANTHHGNWLLASCDEKLPSVCKKEGLVPIPGDEGCPEGWKRRRHFCYKVTDRLQTYEDAVKGYHCKGPLLTVENRFEQAFVNSLINTMSTNVSQYYWTALQDLNRTGEYTWLVQNGSTQPLLYTNWNRHQPVSAGGCVAMTDGQALGRWEVKDCKFHKALSICKQSIESYSETEMPSIHIDNYAPCPSGWESSSKLLHCFKVFHSEKVLMKRSWVEADLFCQALGTNLASFHHYEEEVFVKGLIGSMFDTTERHLFWVGFNKRNAGSTGGWEWSDGTPVVSSFIEDKNYEDDQHNCGVYSDVTNSLTPQPCDFKHEWICKVPRGVELNKPYWYTEPTKPWVFHRNAEYYLDSQPFPWEAVSFACRVMGADLVSIHSTEELRFIKGRMEKLSKGSVEWWIGLFSDISGQLSWRDGSPLDYQNWVGSHPQTSLAEKTMCVYMASPSGEWSEGQCADRRGYVCKRRTVSVVETPREPHYIGRCPEKWFYFGHKCLLLNLPEHPDEGKSWKDAQAICTSFHGSLVTVENEIEQAYITMLLSGESPGVWIGLQDEDHWINGRPVTYSNWSPVEPESSDSDYYGQMDSDDPRCTVLSNNHNFHFTGKWYSEKCKADGYGFVCQKPQDPSKPPSHSYFHPLPDTLEYKNRSYRVFHGNMSWYHALNMCIENDADLVSITEPFQQAFLTFLVNKLAFPHWIGLYSYDGEVTFHWTDKSDVAFTHWGSGDGSGDMYGTCVFMDTSGDWRRASCETPMGGALCQIPAPKSITRSDQVGCAQMWVKFQNSCYSFEPVRKMLSLEEARHYCKQIDNSSDLLTIKSEDENRFVQHQLKFYTLPNHILWLSIAFNADIGNLAWLDGSAITYSNWRYKAPTADTLMANTCVSMRLSDSSWHVSHCTDKLGFVCKTHPDTTTEVEVEPLVELHHSVIPAAVLVALLIFGMVALSVWCVYKRNAPRFRRLASFGNAYYRQADSQATDSDGNVLMADLEISSGE